MSNHFDINEQLENLIVKHNIRKYDKNFILGLKCESCDCKNTEKCRSKKNIAAIINRRLDEIGDDDVVAVRGSGYHSVSLISVLSDKNKNKIRYIVDRDPTMVDFKVLLSDKVSFLLLDELKDKKIDYFILSSYSYKSEMKADLIERGYNKSAIIDLYDCFSEKGIILDEAFYFQLCLSKQMTPVFDNYRAFFDELHHVVVANAKYEDALFIKNDDIIQVTLYEFILNCLSLRDFVTAKKYMRTYIDKKYKDYSMFEGFIVDLDNLFAEIKRLLSEASPDNIIVLSFDGLDPSLVDHMPYMSGVRRESVVFENACVQYPTTTASMNSIFIGKDFMDDRLYGVNRITYENSKLLQTLKSNGYSFYFFFPAKPLFPAEDNDFKGESSNFITGQMWDVFNSIINQKSKGLFFTHFLNTHAPYQCPISKQFSGLRKKYRTCLSEDETCIILLKVLRYLDEQFEFYNSLIPKDVIKIISSDHGGPELKIGGKPMAKKGVLGGNKVSLFINSNKLKPTTYNKLFNTTKFNNLIRYLIGEHNDIYELFDDYMKIYQLPFYDDFLLDKPDAVLPMPQKGILTLEGKYIINYDGTEEYYDFLSDDEYKNRTDEPKYQDRIDELRKLCPLDFKDIFDHPKFTRAKKVYTERGYL